MEDILRELIGSSLSEDELIKSALDESLPEELFVKTIHALLDQVDQPPVRDGKKFVKILPVLAVARAHHPDVVLRTASLAVRMDTMHALSLGDKKHIQNFFLSPALDKHTLLSLRALAIKNAWSHRSIAKRIIEIAASRTDTDPIRRAAQESILEILQESKKIDPDMEAGILQSATEKIGGELHSDLLIYALRRSLELRRPCVHVNAVKDAGNINSELAPLWHRYIFHTERKAALFQVASFLAAEEAYPEEHFDRLYAGLSEHGSVRAGSTLYRSRRGLTRIQQEPSSKRHLMMLGMASRLREVPKELRAAVIQGAREAIRVVTDVNEYPYYDVAKNLHIFGGDEAGAELVGLHNDKIASVILEGWPKKNGKTLDALIKYPRAKIRKGILERVGDNLYYEEEAARLLYTRKIIPHLQRDKSKVVAETATEMLRDLSYFINGGAKTWTRKKKNKK